MGVTTDRNDPGLQTIRADGQQEVYLVLSEDERAKGYVLPVRTKYTHVVCGTETRMPQACAETYARDPKFYGGTFCCHCGKHFPLLRWNDATQANEPQFLWEPDGDAVGADAEEAKAYLEKRKAEEAERRARELEHRRLCAVANLELIQNTEREARIYAARCAELGLPWKALYNWTRQQLADMEAVKEGRPLQ